MNEQKPVPIDRSGALAYGMLIYLVVFLCLFGCSLVVLGDKTLPALLFPAYFMLCLLVFTTFNRTVPLRWVLSCFILGATVVPLATLLTNGLFTVVLDVEDAFFYSVIVPLLEETLKVAPLLTLLILSRWRYRWTVGATDLLILGAAFGSGFGFYEDVLRGFTSTGFSAATLLAGHTATPHLGPFYLFPNMDIRVWSGIGFNRSSGTAAAFIGHGGSTAFIGLTIGLVRILGARLKKRIGGFWLLLWIIPLIVWGWMVFDHGMFNYAEDTAALPILLRIPYTLDWYGRTSSIALYLLILATIAVEQWLLWRIRWRMVGLRLSKDRLRLLKGGLKHPLEIPLHLLALRNFLRERRGLAYGLYGYHHGSRRDGARRAYVEQLARALLLWKRQLELPSSLEPGPGSEGHSASQPQGDER